MKRLFLLAIVCIFCLTSCNSNSAGISKEQEEIIVRRETTELAHFYAWKHDCNAFLNRDLFNILTDFKNVSLHRWDFGDYSAAKADQAVVQYKEYAYEKVWNLHDDTFDKSYSEYMVNYYDPSKYHYVSDEERIFADIYYAVYENAKPSVSEITEYIAKVFKANTPIPSITAIQRLKNKDMGCYWEVYYDNGQVYRVKVIKKENGSFGINKFPSFR